MSLDADDKMCDIIIPVFNRADLTRNCLNSIYECTQIPFRLILIDNNSSSGTKDFLRSFASAHQNCLLVRNEENLGWVKAVNQGMRLSKSPFLCVMNNDTVVRTDGWLAKLMDVSAMDPDIGLVNPHFEAKKSIGADGPFVEIDFCRGYCILIKRSVVEKVGFFDEAYGLGYYDDDDYSVRAIRAGFRCVRANGVFVEHIGDSTFSDMFKDKKRLELHEKNKELFYSKWGRRLRIVFIFTKRADEKIVSDLLLRLARRQHIVYFWTVNDRLGLEHINIREKRLLLGLPFQAMFNLFLNRIKRHAKRYDMVFTDDPGLPAVTAKLFFDTYNFDPAEGDKRIMDLVDSAAALNIR